MIFPIVSPCFPGFLLCLISFPGFSPFFPGFPRKKTRISAPDARQRRRHRGRASAVAALVGVAPRHDAAVAQQRREGALRGGDPRWKRPESLECGLTMMNGYYGYISIDINIDYL